LATGRKQHEVTDLRQTCARAHCIPLEGDARTIRDALVWVY